MATVENNVKCPTCGAGMVLRTAGKGPHAGKQFYGCSRFPRCKGIRDTAPENVTAAPISEQSSSIPEHEQDPFLKVRPSLIKAKEASAVKATPLTDIQKRELAKLRDRLLNVSSRNRSVRLNRLDKKSAFDLSNLNGFAPSLVNKLIEHCLTANKEIPLLPPKDHENEKLWDQLSGSLTHLSRNMTEIFQEKGIRDLYIGFPFISGRPSGTEAIIQAPIFLIPVQLEKTFPKKGMPIWTLKPSADQKAFFNKTLFYALAKLCNLTVSQSIFDEEVPTELYGQQNFIQWTHSLLQNYGVISKIHEEALDQKFDRLPEFTVAEFDENSVGLQIRQNAVLGHFPQSNSSLQKDYEAFLGMSQEDLDGISCFLSEEEFEQDFDGTAVAFDYSSTSQENEHETIDSRSEKDNFFLLASDSSQDKIVLELDKPSTDGIVVWGPPGTGKSQTIVNVIADCIAKGKTVLLVSQKRAALDVVYERLASRNMDSMAALVHDSKEDRRELYRKIASVCANHKTDSLHVLDPAPEITAVTTTLKEVSAAYNDSSFGRKSGLILQELASYKGPILENLDRAWMQANFEAVEQVAQTLGSFQRLPRPSLSVDMENARKSFANLDPELRTEVLNLAKGLLVIGESQTAISIAKASSGNAYISTDSRVEAYRQARVRLSELNSLSRFFSLSFWRDRALISRETRFSARVLRNLTQRTKKSLEPFFEADLLKSLDFVRELEPSISLFGSLVKIVADYFDTFKALDNFRNKLPADVRSLEKQLLGCTESNRNLSWASIFKSSVFDLWSKEIERKHPVISAIKSEQVDALRLRLGELLKLKTDYSVALLQKRLKLSLDDSNGRNFARAISADVEKKRSAPSIRKLNDKFVNEAHFRSMLPVWLVSPETVSDVFPLKKGLFDVVIFDEASQCTVENGLPAIFRGKQIVVAGDEKQLPPGNTFESSIDEEIDDDAIASNEQSLLTLAKKTLRYKAMMLEWHYRSKHQELVTFSNEVFYGGRMKIAPNVIPFVKGNRPAIEWHGVTGFWKDRSNEEEAVAVLKLLKQILSDEKSPSVGVITFNINQKSLIMDLIDRHMQEDPDFAAAMEANRKRPLDQQVFVKNIENVQGDEREVVIFSVAYAPAHPGGRVLQNFGLLNKPGGENRLNVAVTRAISRIHIVSSINPETDLNTSTSAHDGPRIFHKYLCFAKAVAEENFDRVDTILRDLNPNLSTGRNSGQLQFDSPFEEDVFNELASRGYELHSQVGQSGFRIDLAVVDKNDRRKYVLGIECDGAMYHSGVSVRERDVFRQRFLEGRGWKIHRIWSPSWRSNRNREIQKILKILDQPASVDVISEQKSS